MDGKQIKPELELVWGAANIGQVVNLNTRQTFHALETKAIPAKKVGGRWVALASRQCSSEAWARQKHGQDARGTRRTSPQR